MPLESWAAPVNRTNVEMIDLEYSIEDDGGRRWRPYGFAASQLVASYVEVISEIDQPAHLTIEQIPYMRSLAPLPLDNGRSIPLATLWHREGGATSREEFLRVIAVSANNIAGIQAAHFVFGEHPEHPGETGFYLGAVQVGIASMKRYDARLLPPEEWELKYFPIPIRKRHA